MSKLLPTDPNIKITFNCPYCNQPAELCNGAEMYPHIPDAQLQAKFFWRCIPCEASVGCHPGTTSPLGSLAQLELRKARSATHKVFDALWKTNLMTRKEAYRELRIRMGIEKEMCHIGYFNLDECQTAALAAKDIVADEFRKRSHIINVESMAPVLNAMKLQRFMEEDQYPGLILNREEMELHAAWTMIYKKFLEKYEHG